MEKIARMNAMSIGRKRYYTGVPCVHGHLSERLVNGNGCLACMAERRKSVINREKRKLQPCRRKKIIVSIKNHNHVEERKILT